MTKTITDVVTSALANSGETVRQKVIDTLVDQELNKRSEAIVRGLNEQSKLKKEAFKIKPDILAYDDQGQEVSANWSKAKLEEKKKNEDKLSKLEKALEKALDKNDYGDLNNLLNNAKE